ncbi:hypothetical protein GCM10009862_15870 [Microbacterium binotii]|uniref:Uncharacterized protein n=1 Tax=Microbacterium binotii TaxID=462710 RepID=A0ABP6BM94_9MICO
MVRKSSAESAARSDELPVGVSELKTMNGRMRLMKMGLPPDRKVEAPDRIGAGRVRWCGMLRRRDVPRER